MSGSNGLRTVDARTSEADRAYEAWLQRGVPAPVVRELLPLLVGPSATAARARRWLIQHATGVGLDLSPEGQAADRQLLQRAKVYYRTALNRGELAGTDPFHADPHRYAVSERDAEAGLDRTASPHYAGRHNGRSYSMQLAISAAEEEMQRRHGPSAYIDPDTGDVLVTDPQTLKLRKVDHVRIAEPSRPNIAGEDTPSREVSLSNEALEDHRAEAAWDSVNEPFWQD